jgi:hypothetical protein
MKPSPKVDKQRGARYAQGGGDKMFKPQSAGPQKPGITGKNQTPAPGAKAARGGPRTTGHSVSAPAKAGHTAPSGKDR